MKQDFSNRTETKTGVSIRDVKFNSTMNVWLGMVFDKTSFRPDKWSTITWKPSGKCINRNRPELDL